MWVNLMVVIVGKKLSEESARLKAEYWQAVEHPDRNTSVEKCYAEVERLKRQFFHSLDSKDN